MPKERTAPAAAAARAMSDNDDEDPMAHLNAMRERMAAMAQMAEISNMQAALAQRVQASMNRINSIMEEQPVAASAAAASGVSLDDHDVDEAEAWRRKIAMLSVPTDYGSATEATWEATPPEVDPAPTSPATCPTFLMTPAHSEPAVTSVQAEPLEPLPQQAHDAANGGAATSHCADNSNVVRSCASRSVRVSAATVTVKTPPSTNGATADGEDAEVAAWRKRIEELSMPSQTAAAASELAPQPFEFNAPLEPLTEPSTLHANDVEEAAGSTASKDGVIQRLACCWLWSPRHQYAPVVLPPLLVEDEPHQSAETADETYAEEELTRL